MTTTPSGKSGGAPRRPRLNLPFDRRREDAGTWAYDHRIGLCVTLIAYLVLMIVFVSSKIVIGRRPQTQGMYIDLQTLADLECERDRLEREVQERQQEDPIDWGSIRNRVSNENALDDRLKDDRGTNTAALNDAAAEAERSMRANREAYEQGLAEERALRERSGRDGEADERQDSKAARVERGGDECMRETALQAARGSLFNIDASAPARHNGTITYIFIPQ